MRHLKSGRKLNRSASHRKAMLANLATSVLDKERVITTVAKAKEVRGVVERLITYGKRGKNLHAIRLAARTINDESVVKKLFDDIAGAYKDRSGGYTRVLKLAPRQGDSADLAIIELVGRRGEEKRRKPKKRKAVRKKPGVQAVDGAPEGAPAAEAKVKKPSKRGAKKPAASGESKQNAGAAKEPEAADTTDVAGQQEARDEQNPSEDAKEGAQ